MHDYPESDLNRMDAQITGIQRALWLLVFLVALTLVPWAGISYCVLGAGGWCEIVLQRVPVALLNRDVVPAVVGTGNGTVQREKSRTASPGVASLPSGAGVVPVSADSSYVALVIGNSVYARPNELSNPKNDAILMARALAGLNFTLVGNGPQLDLTNKAFGNVLIDFREQAAKAKVAVIYYAGHGVEDRGLNYLVPVDAKMERRAYLESEAISLSRVVASLPGGDNQYGIVILDACRTSNFLLLGDDGKQRSVGQRGLSAQKAPNRAMIAYAASAGEAASDGDGVNSPYVQSLYKHMQEPGIEIKTVFARVQDDFRKSKYAQRPDTSDQLGDVQISFAPERPLPDVGRVFRDCDNCPEMVVVPSGSFMMGAPAEEGGEPDERPVHSVTLAKRFAVSKFEVTYEEFDACVEAGGCAEKPDDEGLGRGRRPVVYVNWSEAKAYVKWLNEHAVRGRGKYRLLTEAEWEFTARAGTTTPFPWGRDASHEFANYGVDKIAEGDPEKGGFKSGRDTWLQASPVGSFPPNGFGLHDMHGNVWEWTEDCYNTSYSNAPRDGSAWTKGDCAWRVMRGGSWDYGASYLRSGFRYGYGASVRNGEIGFRVARSQ